MCEYRSARCGNASRDGHTTSNEPYPVYSVESSGVEPGRYYGGGPRGTACYSSFSSFAASSYCHYYLYPPLPPRPGLSPLHTLTHLLCKKPQRPFALSPTLLHTPSPFPTTCRQSRRSQALSQSRVQLHPPRTCCLPCRRHLGDATAMVSSVSEPPIHGLFVCAPWNSRRLMGATQARKACAVSRAPDRVDCELVGGEAR